MSNRADDIPQQAGEQASRRAESESAVAIGNAEDAAQERPADAARAVADSVGLGIDIVDIARMERILERTPSFAERVFSEDERRYCRKTANPAAHFATRFAAKEAVLKALGTGFSAGICPRDIEVKRNAKGQPRAALYNAAKAAAEEQGVVGLPISLSFTHTEAVACALAVTRSSVAAMQKRTDPMKELAKQFKEVRGLLDDLPSKGVSADDEQQVD